MPYELQLTMASGNDWFSPSFVTGVGQRGGDPGGPAGQRPEPDRLLHRQRAQLGGAGGVRRSLNEYLALPPGSPGLAIAQKYVGNPQGFIYALATRYFQVTSAALKQYDPHHLNLGIKAEGSEIPPALLEAAQPYVDVFSVEDYVLQPGLAQVVLHAWPQYLPLEVESGRLRAVREATADDRRVRLHHAQPDHAQHPARACTDPTQQARAQDFESFISPLYLSSPWLVGTVGSSTWTSPRTAGRGTGRTTTSAWSTSTTSPIPPWPAAMQSMHSLTAQNRLNPTGTSCDSWATGPGGVTCTATVPANPPSSSYPLTIVTRTLDQSTEGSP